VITSLQLLMILAIALTLLTTLTAFSDLLKLASTSKQESLKYQTHICVLVPLIAAFVCQPKFIARVISNRRLQRVRLSDHLPNLASSRLQPTASLQPINSQGNLLAHPSIVTSFVSEPPILCQSIKLE